MAYKSVCQNCGTYTAPTWLFTAYHVVAFPILFLLFFDFVLPLIIDVEKLPFSRYITGPLIILLFLGPAMLAPLRIKERAKEDTGEDA